MPICVVCKKTHGDVYTCCSACRRHSKTWKTRHRMKNLCINHRIGDKRKNRYDESDHVTADYLEQQLATQQSKCHHCKIVMNITSGRVDNGMWLQRLDNTKGHTQANTVLACRACNVRRVESGFCKEWLLLRKGQVEFDALISEGYQLLSQRRNGLQ